MQDARFSNRRRLLRMFGAGVGGAFLWPQIAAAQTSDYRALVCVLLEGGSDGENTLIRYDSTGYQQYASVRTVASGINIPQSTLLPIQPPSQSVPYGLHPACGPLQTLFNQKKLAVLANVGMLKRPVTRAGLIAKTDPRPAQLFSHADQVRQVQTADATDILQTGWGGRLADRLSTFNAGNPFPPLTTLGDVKPFINGNTSIPLALPTNDFFAIMESGNVQVTGLRDAALLQMLGETRSNLYERAAQTLANQSLQSSTVVNPILGNQNTPVTALFNSQYSDIGRQLRQVARLIEAREKTGLKRQVFFVRQALHDTHTGQLGGQQGLLSSLTSALQAFSESMLTLGLDQNVTTFTLSDFGRTFKPAAGAGTDHGWGNYAFVMGGAVKGGDFYGRVATPILGGPDDLGDDGRWIPTTSIEQYGATLANWFGIDAQAMSYVFPNLASFSTGDLGFMTLA